MASSSIKSLAKDTAIYGISSMVGRFLNWLLVPLYTREFLPDEYGVVTEIYAYVAILMIVLTFGMETGFFRFANHNRWNDPMQVYTTAMTALLAVSLTFTAAVCVGAPLWAGLIDCPDRPSFVVLMGITVAIDSFSALPFSYLRFKKRPVRFAVIKLLGIGINITLNLFFILFLPWVVDRGVSVPFYDPAYGIGYIFISNLVASAVTLLLLAPELRCRWSFNLTLFREMFSYSFPLLVLGLAGILNQSIDKVIYKWLVPDQAEAMAQIGIYGANYKIAVILVMFLQAFRFAYDPFIFAKQKEEKKRGGERAYADAMKWFVIVAMFIFLAVMMTIDIVKILIDSNYYSGLKVVPLIMGAEIFFGIFYNLSVWYKVTDRTYWGTWFTIIGLAITLGMNAILVPRIGYMGCAWAAVACYGSMAWLSWIVGRLKHPIGYDLKSIGFYIFLGVALWIGADFVVKAITHAGLSFTDALDSSAGLLGWIVKVGAMMIFVSTVIIREKLPVKHFGSVLLKRIS